MTTLSYNRLFDTTTDAGWQAIGPNLADLLIAAGFVQTADTGQIDWPTVVSPTAGQQNKGYEVWRLDDAQQVTQPVFCKFEFSSYPGSSSTSYKNSFYMYVTVGTGSDGAGNITGGAFSRVYVTGMTNDSSGSSNSNYQSWACNFNGAHWLVFNYGATFSRAFCITRWTDSAGVVTDDGYTVYAGNDDSDGVTTHHVPRIGTTWEISAGRMSFIPGEYDANIGGVEQIFPHFAITPAAVAQIGALTVPTSLLTAGSTIAATPAGSVEHTYIGIGRALGKGAQNSGHIALIWE